VAGVKVSDGALAIVRAAGLDQAAVGGDGAGGAPGVGEDGERADGVGGHVVLGGVGGAVDGEGPVAGVVPAAAAGEGDVGGAKVGAVEDDDAVVGQQLHVHRRHADAGLEKLPSPSSGRGSKAEEEEEERTCNRAIHVYNSKASTSQQLTALWSVLLPLPAYLFKRGIRCIHART
ncbi:unnamed protein product, partial [Musa banksii]